MDEKCTQLWQKLSFALKPQVSADTFKRWFSAVELVQADNEALTFRVPNNIYQFWIESNYMTSLEAAVLAAVGAPREIRFTSSGTAAVDPDNVVNPTREMPVEDGGREPKSGGSALGLNPRNTFESFVVGPNNELAYAA